MSGSEDSEPAGTAEHSSVGELVALQALAAAAIAGLALVLAVWAAALIVAGGLLVVAGIVALAAKSEIGRALPPTPLVAMESVRADVEMLTERAHP